MTGYPNEENPLGITVFGTHHYLWKGCGMVWWQMRTSVLERYFPDNLRLLNLRDWLKVIRTS